MLAKIEAFKRESNIIGGEWVAADSGETFDVHNPATGETIGTVPMCGASETRRAIETAHAAFLEYSKRSALDRCKLLRKLAKIIRENKEELAQLLSLEQGKPISEARGEVNMSAKYVHWFSEEARRVYGDTIPSPWPDRRILVTHQAVGVAGCITPWNFPSSMLARKIAPALAAGCTVVCKPAEATPYSGLAWGILCEMAGFPKGAVNIITGDPVKIGEELCSNGLVRKLTFTGSTRVGKILMKQAAETVKKVSMELGGNAPFIVFDDADVDRAVEGAIAAKFRNTGQTCVCTNRLLVQSRIHGEFVEKFTKATQDLKMGEANDDGVTQGPMIDDAAVKKVHGMVEEAVGKGAHVIIGGSPADRKGSFFQPTVMTGATPDMQFAREEIFGPVAPIYEFDNEEEAIHMANDTEFGLAAYFYTQDLGRTIRVMEGLEYGLVGVNEGIITTVEAPFGGFKESGVGREGGYQGIEDYLETKYVCLGGLGLSS